MNGNFNEDFVALDDIEIFEVSDDLSDLAIGVNVIELIPEAFLVDFCEIREPDVPFADFLVMTLDLVDWLFGDVINDLIVIEIGLTLVG